jgi:hypothetical protein
MPSGAEEGRTPDLCIANIGDRCSSIRHNYEHDKIDFSDCPANPAWAVNQWRQGSPAGTRAGGCLSATAPAGKCGRIKKARECGLKRLFYHSPTRSASRAPSALASLPSVSVPGTTWPDSHSDTWDAAQSASRARSAWVY